MINFKNVSAVFALLIVSGASAETRMDVPSGTEGVYLIQAELLSVSKGNPCRRGGPDCVRTNYANLNFTLGGCVDQLGPVSYEKKETRSGKITLTVTAYAFANKESKRVKCYAAPTEQRKVVLGPGNIDRDSIEVKNTDWFDAGTEE